MSEIVYILINEAMPGYIKIGKTTDLERRMKELDNTSIPLPFECFYACTVKDMDFVEKQMHEAFADHKTRSNREFFTLSPVRAAAVLKLVELEDVTPRTDIVESQEDQQALNKARSRRPNFNFKLLDIPLNSELTFVYDEKIKAIVVDDTHIELDGERLTTTAAATKLLPDRITLQGPLFWMFEGENLVDRRNRLESEEYISEGRIIS